MSFVPGYEHRRIRRDSSLTLSGLGKLHPIVWAFTFQPDTGVGWRPISYSYFHDTPNFFTRFKFLSPRTQSLIIIPCTTSDVETGLARLGGCFLAWCTPVLSLGSYHILILSGKQWIILLRVFIHSFVFIFGFGWSLDRLFHSRSLSDLPPPTN